MTSLGHANPPLVDAMCRQARLLWHIGDGYINEPVLHLDSMDWLNFLIGLHRRFQVDIPESDYARLRTLDDLTIYLRNKLG